MIKKIQFILIIIIAQVNQSVYSQSYSTSGTSGVRYLRISYNDDPSTTAVIGWD